MRTGLAGRTVWIAATLAIVVIVALVFSTGLVALAIAVSAAAGWCWSLEKLHFIPPQIDIPPTAR